MDAPKTVDVCIATFRRPLILAALLESLRAQNLDGIAMRIVVVDNDREQSAQQVVEQFRADSGLPVVYAVEPQQNIALARNRALQLVEADYFAFVDDDETVSPGWLQALLDSVVRYDADLVFGPVLSTLPADAPSWARNCFHRPRRPTGSLLQYGGAGNMLARRAVVGQARFDPTFGLTGGEDTEFFYRLYCAGARLVWCDEAVASEPVSATRLTPTWLRRREFRSGQTFKRIFVSRYSSGQKAMWFVMKCGQLLGALMAAPLVRCLSYPRYVALTARIAAASGQLAACFSGRAYEEYNARHYQ
jgi:succinoglycan biosynthesis protein ExoM